MKQNALIFYSFLLLYSSCANQTTPGGGPKDLTPPQLQKSIPGNNEKNFTGKTIELTFDELVKLNNANEEIIISPSPGKDVQFTARSNKVIIEPKTTWQDSTTYSISFRDAIQDVNEGNPTKNLHMAFSTGPTIDSLVITGSVIQAMSEKIPEKITVAIYQSDTFDIFTDTPPFFTQTKKDGTFKIENLKDERYFLYAFDDKNKNLKVESKTERFGFLKPPVRPNENKDTISISKSKPKPITDTLSISVYLIDSRPIKINTIRNSGRTTTVTFNKYFKSYSLSNPSKKQVIHSFGEDQTEIVMYYPPEAQDSVQLTLSGIDSLSQKTDSTFYIKSVKSKASKDVIKMKYSQAIADAETGEFTLSGTYSIPISRINFDSAYISIDTLSRIGLNSGDLSIDSAKKEIHFKKIMDKKILTAEKPPKLNLTLSKGFIISIEGDSTKKEEKELTIISEDQTGTLLVNVQTKHKYFEVQLLGIDGKIIQSRKNQKNITFKKLKPQEYKLRAYVDVNNNGFWDAQNILTREPSEPVTYYKTEEKKYNFPIRATWELGPLLLKF